MINHLFRPVALTLCFVSLSACAGLNANDIFNGAAAEAPLTESTVVDGLKEALSIGTRRTSSTLSARGGFSDNPLLRITLPDELNKVANTLRKVGLGSRVDSFETTMNRAAEAAAGEAVDVFVAAIRSMSIADAFGILNGPENAATEYFRGRTSEDLRARFTPIVDGVMRTTGVYRTYTDVVGAYNKIPLTKSVDVDLEAYITGRTLDGLFQVLAGEEKRIRDDPLARTTALLQRVFK